MNKEQLQKDIDAMREKLAEMEAKLKVKEKKKKYFIPEPAEKYWANACWGRGNTYFEANYGGDFDTYNIDIGNCYKTKEEALKAAAKQKAYIRIVRALRDHEEDGYERDSVIYYSIDSVYTQTYRVSSYNHIKFSCLNKELFSTYDACRWVIDNMKDDLNLYFGE